MMKELEMDNTAPISEQVVQRMERATGLNPGEMPPLYDSIDPDALDTLVTRMADGEIRFRYIDHWIVITSSGDVQIHALSDTDY